MDLFRGSLATFSGWWSLSFLPFLSSSYDLLLIIDIYFHLLSCLFLRFFKGKQRPIHTKIYIHSKLKKKNWKTPIGLARLHDAADTDVLSFIFLKFWFYHFYN
jgi:hypothetical protein